MNKRLNIIVDLDEILVDLKNPWLAIYNEKYNDNLTIAKATDFDLANVVKKECGEKVNELLTYDLFRNCKPVPGSIDAVSLLSAKHNVHIVSAHHAPIPTSAVAKIEWCYEYLPFINKRKITLTHQKHLIRADIIIDDKYQTVAECDAFMAAATIAYPWNQAGAMYYDLYAKDYRNTEKCWSEILEWIDWYAENFEEANARDD